MEPGRDATALARDVLRGAGYAVTAFSLLLLSFGHPAPWLPWLAAAGIAALVAGILLELMHTHSLHFVLNRRQSAAFVVASVVSWGLLGLTGSSTWGATTGCTSALETYPLGETAVDVALASPPGDAEAVPVIGPALFPPNEARGTAPFTAPNATAFIHVRLLDGLDVSVHSQSADGEWAPAVGGGADAVDGWQPYGRADFSDLALRVAVDGAPAERDGSTQTVELRFLGERDANQCMA